MKNGGFTGFNGRDICFCPRHSRPPFWRHQGVNLRPELRGGNGRIALAGRVDQSDFGLSVIDEGRNRAKGAEHAPLLDPDTARRRHRSGELLLHRVRHGRRQTRGKLNAARKVNRKIGAPRLAAEDTRDRGKQNSNPHGSGYQRQKPLQRPYSPEAKY